MDLAIRELDAAALDIVAGGNKAWDLAKIWAGVIGSVVAGPVGGGLAASAVIGVQAAHENPYVPDCSGTTGGCDSGTMQN
jgi:hypothetical protein